MGRKELVMSVALFNPFCSVAMDYERCSDEKQEAEEAQEITWSMLPPDAQEIIASGCAEQCLKEILKTAKVSRFDLHTNIIEFQNDPRVECVAWHPDGIRVAFGAEGSIWIYDSETRKQLIVKYLHQDSADYRYFLLKWHPDGTQLALINKNDLKKVVFLDSDLNDRETLNARSVAWHPDGSLLAVAKDNKVCIKDCQTKQCIYSFDAPQVDSMLWNSSGSQLANFSTHNNVIGIYDIENGECVRTIQLQPKSRPKGDRLLSWIADSSCLAFDRQKSRHDHSIHIYNTRTGEYVKKMKSYYSYSHFLHRDGDVFPVALSPDGLQLAIGDPGLPGPEEYPSLPGCISLVNAQTGKCFKKHQTFNTVNGVPSPVAWSSDGSRLAFGGHIIDMQERSRIKQWLQRGCPSMKVRYRSKTGERKKIEAPPFALFALVNKLLLPPASILSRIKNKGKHRLTKTEIALWGCLPAEVQRALTHRVKKKKRVPITYGQSLLKNNDSKDTRISPGKYEA